MSADPALAAPPTKIDAPTQPAFGLRRQQLGLALLSGSGLFLEISLTRLFSTLFFAPYVFAILSVAVLGIGLGAALATVRPAWRSPARLPLYLSLAGLSTLLLLLTVVWTLGLDLRGGLLLLVLPPYLFVGLSLVIIFSMAPAASAQLYRADLWGAGGGAILAIPLLNGLGGLNSLLGAAALFGLAALVIAPRQRWATAVSGLALLGLVANLNPATTWLTLDLARSATIKPLTERLANGGRILHTRWDSFARTDLVDPGQGRPYEIYLDGAAGSVMPPVGEVNLLRRDIGFFPFATTRPEQVMIIGPGGGLDVLFGLSAQARSVTAVEINPASVALVERLAAYHGDLYAQPGVRVIVGEGRSVLRREQTRYDLIYLSQVVTLAAERSGYALTENTIYTVEAFGDYLAQLQPGGQIAMKLYDELTLSRAMITAVTALQQTRGLAEAEALGHLAIFLDAKASPPIPLLLIQDRPFNREEGLALAGVAAQVDFVPLFVPHVAGDPTLTALLAGEASLAALIAASPSDISATTDDRPFFYQFERGVPAALRPLLAGLGAVLLLGLVGLGLSQRRVAAPVPRYAPLYFAALGLGFITLELAFIQQTRLFLGHPTLAVTTVLAVLLIGGGLGSGWLARGLEELEGWTVGRSVEAITSNLPGFQPSYGDGPASKQRDPLSTPKLGDRTSSVVLSRGWSLPAAIGGLGLLWLLAWPWLSDALRAAPLALRLLVVIGTLAPLALLMGTPFPLGLRRLTAYPTPERQVALAWAVNGVMTVVGSVLAITGAMLIGFSGVLLLGIGAYALAAGLAYLAGDQA